MAAAAAAAKALAEGRLPTTNLGELTDQTEIFVSRCANSGSGSCSVCISCHSRWLAFALEMRFAAAAFRSAAPACCVLSRWDLLLAPPLQQSDEFLAVLLVMLFGLAASLEID